MIKRLLLYLLILGTCMAAYPARQEVPRVLIVNFYPQQRELEGKYLYVKDTIREVIGESLKGQPEVKIVPELELTSLVAELNWEDGWERNSRLRLDLARRLDVEYIFWGWYQVEAGNLYAMFYLTESELGVVVDMEPESFELDGPLIDELQNVSAQFTFWMKDEIKELLKSLQKSEEDEGAVNSPEIQAEEPKVIAEIDDPEEPVDAGDTVELPPALLVDKEPEPFFPSSRTTFFLNLSSEYIINLTPYADKFQNNVGGRLRFLFYTEQVNLFWGFDFAGSQVLTYPGMEPTLDLLMVSLLATGGGRLRMGDFGYLDLAAYLGYALFLGEVDSTADRGLLKLTFGSNFSLFYQITEFFQIGGGGIVMIVPGLVQNSSMLVTLAPELIVSFLF